jgi:formiminoglutamase
MIEVVQGGGPLVLGLPHTGTYVPHEIAARLNARGRALADTDWHIERLYDGLVGDVTTVRTRVHRYVIDVNRDPSGESLYPGQNTTGLIPLTDFDGEPIWGDGDAPDAAEVEARRVAYHAPYHAALSAEMERVRAWHGFAILYDCHSIRSRIPFLFDGTLPDLNIGTKDGTTCAPGIAAAVRDACAASGYSTVTNGRFKGGWTTRHYGRPGEGLHAIQMELAQSTYLAAEAPPWDYDETRAAHLRAVLRPMLETLSEWRP